eukprot:jgi/Orpsp1_1/1188389/evm.model.d7180000064401.1
MSNFEIDDSIKKKDLNSICYPSWADDVYLFLGSKNLEEYVDKEILVKVKKGEEGYEEGCLPVNKTSDLFYKKGITKDIIHQDVEVKYILSQCINDKIREGIDFRSNTSYQIWKLLEETYLKSNVNEDSNLQ